MTAPSPDDIIRDLRTFTHSCADNLKVPLAAILEHVASFGGVEQYSDPADAVGHAECREKIRGFCSDYVLAHLPEEAKTMGNQVLARRRPGGAFVGRIFWDLAEPVLKEFHVMRADWNETVCKALKLLSVFELYKYPGNEAHAVETLRTYLAEKKGSSDVTKEEDLKRQRVKDHVAARWTEWEIADPTKQGNYWKDCFEGKTMPDVIFSPMSADAIIAQFDAGMAPRIAGLKELRAQGLDKDYLKLKGNGNPFANHPPAAVPGNGSVPASDSVNDQVSDTSAATPGETLKQAARKQAKKKESAGDAIPFEGVAEKKVDLTNASTTRQEGQGAAEGESQAVEPDAKNGRATPSNASQGEAVSAPPTKPEVMTGEFVFADDDNEQIYHVKVNEISDGTYGVTITVDDLEVVSKTKNAVFEKIKFLSNLGDDLVLIEEWFETNPSLDRINALRNRAYNEATAVFPTLSQDQRIEKIKEVLDGKTIKDAICEWGDDGALERVRLAFANVVPEKKESLVDTTSMALATTDAPPVDLTTPQQPSNVVSFPGAFGFRLPSPLEWQFMVNMSKFVVASGFYPAIKSPEAAMMVMIKGFTLGADPIASLDGIDPIQSSRGTSMFFRGKFAKALVERTGQCEKFMVTGDDNKAQAVVKRKGRQENVYTFTIDDAKKADLTKKAIWSSHPAKMLKWRVISQAVSIEFPEVYFAFSVAGPEEEEEAA